MIASEDRPVDVERASDIGIGSTSPQPQPAAGTPAAAANQSYWQKAQGYVPTSVSATAMTAGDRVKSGVDSVFTQQNRDAVSPILPTMDDRGTKAD